MKIKIDEQNREAINAALAAANGKATAHTFTTASEVIAAANDAEAQIAALGISKNERAGATARASSGGKLPNAYKYSRVTTRITITRGASAWFLTELTTADTWDKSAGGTYVTVTAAQDAIAIAKFRASYSVAKVVAEVAS
jgi:hypothetical protein